ncbi:MAG TPA: tail-specific protease, partial [Bacteroidetes bacterium]|nr:tail-specific protease [Bacteroidota bacterium]
MFKFKRSIMLKGLIVGLVAMVALFFGNQYKSFNSGEQEKAIVYTVKNMLDYVHFSPQKLNDDFSQKIYEKYLNDIDGLKRFLTKEDIARLEPYKYQLDDQLRESNLEFFDLSYNIINASIDKVRNYYKEILDTPFKFDTDEKLELDPEKRTWPENDNELKEVWRKFLKYEVLTRVASKLEDQEKSKSDTVKILSFEEIEKDSRSKVLKIYNDMFDRIKKLRRSDRFEVYINAFANLEDPHTEYFSPKDKEDFDIRMGGKLEGIGARLQADGDFTKVVSIIPGGPAWKGKELEPKDLILKVAQGDSEDFVDLTGMRLDDVVRLIRGKKGTKVRLEVKKPDATIEIIEIIRDEVIIEETKAKSIIVGLKNEIDSIGFIRLPSFYSDFKSDGNNCADDIKKELNKLNDKNVKGIILDLRYNGGGSLRDVIKIAGYFIEQGPVVQVKPGKEKPFIHKDNDIDVVYNGPLVILVNEMSASASEIMAAAMQDYDRAIIIGSKATFGKGTVQRFFDLDNMIRGADDVKPLGNLKVTTQKFYRINGGSTQLKGVESDIVLPDNYMYMDVGEREYKNAMPWDKIANLDYSQNVFVLNKKDEIINRSKKRIEQDTVFTYIKENAMRMKLYSDSTLVSLNLDTFKKQKDERKKKDDFYKKRLNNEIPSMIVENL